MIIIFHGKRENAFHAIILLLVGHKKSLPKERLLKIQLEL